MSNEHRIHKYIIKLTLHLTDLTIFFTLASQKAPLYLALTSVPTGKNGGSSPAWQVKQDYQLDKNNTLPVFIFQYQKRLKPKCSQIYGAFSSFPL